METTEEDKKKAARKSYMAEYNKKYRKDGGEHLKNKERKYREENSERIKEYRKKYYSENYESIKIKRKADYNKNSEKIKSKNKRYYIKNSEKIKIYKNEYIRNRVKSDPMFKMVKNLRRSIHRALKDQGIEKNIKSLELFGAPPDIVWKHLESHFKEGMTRENNTPKGWHIDHIKPFSSFDLNDPEQLKACNHYTNLQPLWWWENLSKADKIV